MVYTSSAVEFVLRSYLTWLSDMTSCTTKMNDTYQKKRKNTEVKAKPAPCKAKANQEIVEQLSNEDKLCLMADIETVMPKLFYKDAQVLFYRLVCKHTLKETAEAMGVDSIMSLSRMEKRALLDLCFYLNGGNIEEG